VRKSATEQTASPPELAAAPAGLLDPKEIATRIGLSQSSVHRLMDEGRLPHFRFGRARRVAESDLAEFLDSSRIGARKPK
jgi:excisionase family DNA binding protein